MSETSEDLILKHTLLNAHRHGGLAEVGAVLSKVLAEKPQLKEQVKDIIPTIRSIVEQVNKLPADEQFTLLSAKFPDMLEAKDKPKAKVLPPLLNAEMGKVVTRFPPEPNGYPHIGHAKAVIIDREYAKMYRGKFILRFDDTNPAKEKKEYYQAIADGLTWLGIRADLVKNTSDDLEQLYQHAEKLIKMGHAYVCTCPADEVKAKRMKGEECNCRAGEIEKHLARWRMMFKEYARNDAILRLKADIKNANTTMRDPTLFRIVDAEHPLKGSRYRVWPTYDFAAPVEDSLDGVTHAMRSKEYELRDEPYQLIITLLGLRRPEVVEFSRLEMKGTPVSKRKLSPLVEQKLVQGWDDPRMPTLVGLRRRGFTPEAIREFILSLGVSKSESEPTWDLLESINRKILDPNARRYFFVPEPVVLEVPNAPALVLTLKHHPEQDLGKRTLETSNRFYISRSDFQHLRSGDEFRLMEAFNVKVVEKSADRIVGRHVGDEVRDVPKIQWVPERRIEFKVLVPGLLFQGDQFNKSSLVEVDGYAEEACEGLQVDEHVQFVRFGFCRIDTSHVAILTHK